jgi:DNA (cytosine-5)-methyltransferase 1
MTAYYNEIDKFAAQWLRNLIAAGHIAPGEVDTRSIDDVKPDDVRRLLALEFGIAEPATTISLGIIYLTPLAV